MAIDFDDLTETNETDKSASAGVDARISELRSLGKEPSISPEEAEAMSTSTLILSVVKFPELIGELAMGVSLVAGDKEAFEDILAAAQNVGQSLNVCGEELDARIPARRTKSEEE